MASFLMKPMKLDRIRVKAHVVRRAFGYDADGYIDIVKVLESMQDKGVDVEIMPKSTMGNKHGQTFPMIMRVLQHDIKSRENFCAIKKLWQWSQSCISSVFQTITSDKL